MAITSLFGPTPAQIQEARMQQMEEQIAGEGRELGPFRGLYQAARRLGSAGGQSLVSGLFPEAADPALREAQAIESIKMKYQGQDFTNPSVLRSMANELGSVAPNAAIRLAQLSKELSPKETKANEIGKTPQGFQVYQDGDQQYYLRDGKRVPYYGTLRQETVAPTGTKQIAAIQGIRGDYLKEVKPEFDAFSSLDSAKRSLTQLSGIGDELAKRQLLKASGESGSGLSNKDVAAFASFGPLGQRIAGTINRFLEGTYSDDQRKEIISLINQLQGQLQRQADEKGKQYRDFASGIEGVTNKDINFITPSLSSIYSQNAVPLGTSPTSTQGATRSRELTTKTGNRARVLPSQ
jgi:hypothetical protein